MLGPKSEESANTGEISPRRPEMAGAALEFAKAALSAQAGLGAAVGGPIQSPIEAARASWDNAAPPAGPGPTHANGGLHRQPTHGASPRHQAQAAAASRRGPAAPEEPEDYDEQPAARIAHELPRWSPRSDYAEEAARSYSMPVQPRAQEYSPLETPTTDSSTLPKSARHIGSQQEPNGRGDASTSACARGQTRGGHSRDGPGQPADVWVGPDTEVCDFHKAQDTPSQGLEFDDHISEGSRHSDHKHKRLHAQPPGGGGFADIRSMNKCNMDEVAYDVTSFYHTSGNAQAIARSVAFDNCTLVLIGVNAVYIGVEADNNKASTLLESPWPYQACDHAFCVLFLVELIVRFAAFAKKLDCLKDAWFKFDLALVVMMVVETWMFPLMSIFAGRSGPGFSMGPLRLLRLARMVRLARSFPEMVTLIKGLRRASRAVASSLLMVLLIIYVFAILLHSLLKEESSVRSNFRSVPLTMWTLWMDGTLMDSTGDRVEALMDNDRYVAVVIFTIFLLLSALTLMNMLIGVLCEVVSAVGEAEKEDAAIKMVKGSLLVMLKRLDEDGNGQICKTELQGVLMDPHAQETLDAISVDTRYLMDLQEMIYPTEESYLTIEEIMELILQHRGDRHPTMKDMADMLKFQTWNIHNQWKKERMLERKKNWRLGAHDGAG